ncbi:MAG: hypothetical protein EXR75_07130 [Myxococcales bacterium]|nr:hypothetical protein [Myxococcales bacterium]
MSVLPRLDAFEGQRDAPQRVGRAALELGHVPSTSGARTWRRWVIEARVFGAHAAEHLSGRLDVRSLIKHADTPEGDERCARAFELLSRAPLTDELRSSLGVVCEALRAGTKVGLRPFIVTSSERRRVPIRFDTLIVLPEAEAVSDAVRRIFAELVTSRVIDALALAEKRDASLAVVIEEVDPCVLSGWLIRGQDGGVLGAGVSVVRASDARLAAKVITDQPSTAGVSVAASSDARVGGRDTMAMAPLEVVAADEAGAPSLVRLRDELGAKGVLELAQVFEAVSEGLGPSARVHFAVREASLPAPRIVILSVEDASDAVVAEDAGDHGVWSELCLVGRSQLPSRLASVELTRLVRSGLAAAAQALGQASATTSPVARTLGERVYLGIGAVTRSAERIPMVGPRDVLYALGAGSHELLEKIFARADEQGPQRVREALAATTAVRTQLGFEREAAEFGRRLAREAHALGELELALLPNDSMASTLSAARELLDRCGDQWSSLRATQLGHELTLHALVARRVPSAHELVGTMLTAGVPGTFGASLALGIARVADVFATDAAACTRLHQAPVLRAQDLPDGPARGALAQFLSTFGDVAVEACELSFPRWSEDASDATQMVKLWLAHDSKGSRRAVIEAKEQLAGAMADAELARFEPEFGSIERKLFRWLLDRTRDIARSRIAIERLGWRALAILRRVVLDVDRRLVRIDPRARRGTVFHASLDVIVTALKSGRPELGRLVLMREAERQSLASSPPPAFSGRFSYAPSFVRCDRELAGVGVSVGVVDGAALIVGDRLPERVTHDDVLIVRALDVALSPIFALAGAVVAESGGAVHPCAEAMRELAIPCVASVAGARVVAATAERVRVDGAQGLVSRATRTVQG